MSFLRAIGTGLRSWGKSIDAMGVSMQGSSAYVEKRTWINLIFFYYYYYYGVVKIINYKKKNKEQNKKRKGERHSKQPRTNTVHTRLLLLSFAPTTSLSFTVLSTNNTI